MRIKIPMRNFEKCKICNEYDWEDTHKCNPKWDIYEVNFDDPSEKYYAYGEYIEEAVEKYVSLMFTEWEYPNEMEIKIRKDSSEDWQTFNIDVDMIPDFMVTKKM